MSNNSDPLYEQYADMDFTDAMPVADVPALAKLQAEQGETSIITIRVDSAILSTIKARAEISGADYRALINEALRQFVEGTNFGADCTQNDSRRASSSKMSPGLPP